jgi:hypothetical protein
MDSLRRESSPSTPQKAGGWVVLIDRALQLFIRSVSSRTHLEATHRRTSLDVFTMHLNHYVLIYGKVNKTFPRRFWLSLEWLSRHSSD